MGSTDDTAPRDDERPVVQLDEYERMRQDVRLAILELDGAIMRLLAADKALRRAAG